MEHTLVDKSIALRDDDHVEITVLDPDQRDQMQRDRERLLRSHREFSAQVPSQHGLKRPFPFESSSVQKNVRVKRLRKDAGTRGRPETQGTVSKSPLDVLTDDLLMEIFSHLPQLPSILTIRQVCRRWYTLSCNPRLWRALSFEGHEHVTSTNVEVLCRSMSIFAMLKTLSLAKVHGVGDEAVRNIPRTCAASLQDVDLSWCSGATDKSVVEFSRCPGLRELRLSHCRRVTRRSVRILAVRCPRLQVLDMNCISGVRDSLLKVIGQNCPFLRVLNIANARNVTDDGVTHMTRGCVRLEVLDLSWCLRISDYSVLRIAENLPHLRELGLSETRVTDIGMSELTRCCSRLQILHLARCVYITDTGVDSIISHCQKRLISLNLATCELVSDQFVERLIRECPKLKSLDVSKLPCREISGMLDQITSTRDIEVYF